MIDQSKMWLYRLLRQSERYTGTDMVYLTKGGVWLSINQIFSTLTGLILLVLFANLLPPEVYGNYRYVLSVIGVLVIGTFTGINSVAIKAVAEGKERIFWRLVLKKTYFSLGATILSMVVSLYYYINGNILLSLAFVIASIGIPLAYTSGMYDALLQGRKNFKLLTQLNIIGRLVITLGIALTIYFSDNLLALILVYFIPEIIIQFVFLGFLYKNPKPDGDIESEKRFARFGIHLSFMDVLKTVASQIDKLLVFHFLGPSQLAMYTIATAPPSQIKSFMQNLTTLAFPKLSVAKDSDVKNTLPQKIFKLELIIVLIIIAYGLAAPILFAIFFPKYIEVVLLSQVYTLTLLFFPRTFLSTAMVAHIKQKELYYIRVLAPTGRIIIFLIALPLWGLWGAVLGAIAGNALTTLIYKYYFDKAFKETNA